MATVRLAPLITGNVGLYYCCYRLSLLEWNVMPTARNARGVDIIAYSADASRFLGIQVKALSRRFWIIVNRVASDTPSAFVLTPSEVKERAVRVKSGPVQYFLQPPRYDQSQFKEAWDRIGHGGLESGMAASATAEEEK